MGDTIEFDRIFSYIIYKNQLLQNIIALLSIYSDPYHQSSPITEVFNDYIFFVYHLLSVYRKRSSHI